MLVRPGTDAERIAGELADCLADYPVLDEEDMSGREYDAAIEGIRDQAGNWIRDDAPDDWPARVYRHIPDPGVYTQPGGGSVDDDKLIAICRSLKLIPPKYLRVRVLRLRQVRRPTMPAFYRDITVKRYNPDYPF